VSARAGGFALPSYTITGDTTELDLGRTAISWSPPICWTMRTVLLAMTRDVDLSASSGIQSLKGCVCMESSKSRDTIHGVVWIQNASVSALASQALERRTPKGTGDPFLRSIDWNEIRLARYLLESFSSRQPSSRLNLG